MNGNIKQPVIYGNYLGFSDAQKEGHNCLKWEMDCRWLSVSYFGTWILSLFSQVKGKTNTFEQVSKQNESGAAT